MINTTADRAEEDLRVAYIQFLEANTSDEMHAASEALRLAAQQAQRAGLDAGDALITIQWSFLR